MTVVIVFITLLLVGVPIAFVLGLTGVFYMAGTGDFIFFDVIPELLISAPNNFSLLAIPLFILAGEVMNSGGITIRLANFARSIVGHLRGGLAHVNILVSALLSSIVGSANAVAAIQSTYMIPEMKKDGYDAQYAASITAAGSIMGPIIPPSLILIMYGAATSTSIGALFMGGIIPGLMLAAGFILMAYLYARKKKFEVKKRVAIKLMLKNFVKAFPALLIPFSILGGMFSGFFTPTEAGAIGSLLAFIIGMFVYKDLKIKHIPKILKRTGVVSASVVIIASAAGLLGWVVTMERIPQMIAETLLSISDSQWVILLILNIFLLFVGMFLDPLSAVIILVPILLPAILQLGIDPLHFGIVISLNLTIGLLTPPVGIVLFIVSGISKVSLISLSRGVLPFVIMAILILLIITYIPSVVTFIPEYFMG